MKTLRRFLAALTIAFVAIVWTGCEEDEDPTIAGLPFAGNAWRPVTSLFATNALTSGLDTVLR